MSQPPAQTQPPIQEPVINEARLYSIIQSNCEPILATKENGEWPRLILYSCKVGYALCRTGRNRTCRPMFTAGILDALGAYAQTLEAYAKTLQMVSQNLAEILGDRNRIVQELMRAAKYYENEYEYAAKVLSFMQSGDIETALKMLRKIEGGSKLSRLLEALVLRLRAS